jgi:ammonia channel protein AmtB
MSSVGDADRVQALTSRLTELLIKTQSLEELLATRRLNDFTELKDGPLNSGDTAFLIISSALVFLVTIPGMGLYYAGMVHVKNALTTVMQCFSIACVITIVYMIFGYSLAFGNPAQGGLPVNSDQRSSPVYGDGSRMWFHNLGSNTVHQSAPSMPEAVYATYQVQHYSLSHCLPS